MRTAPSLLVLLATLGTAVAAPRPPAPTTFAAPATYDQCTTSWAFACGKRDGAGRTYGTAHPMQHCARYAFAADGTYTVTVTGGIERIHTGTYGLAGDKVVLRQADDTGAVITYDLVLGGMKRVQ